MPTFKSSWTSENIIFFTQILSHYNRYSELKALIFNWQIIFYLNFIHKVLPYSDTFMSCFFGFYLCISRTLIIANNYEQVGVYIHLYNASEH